MRRPSWPAPGGWLLRLLSRPWIDPICLWGMGRLLPASRLWATAALAMGDVAEFSSRSGIPANSEKWARRLGRTHDRRLKSEQAQANWEMAVFGGTGDPGEVEAERRTAAQAYLADRFAYLVSAGVHRVPAADFSIPSPTALKRELRAALSKPGRFFAPPTPLPKIDRSRPIHHVDAMEYWLRFPGTTEDMSDTAYVHVYEPKSVPVTAMPSLIFCHGLAMELEMLAEAPRDFLALAQTGVRVLLPDAPGHNRRCRLGSYGGESFIRRAPISSIRHFQQASTEFATIVDWCRAQGKGRVALGGISLGALSAQVAASRWADWPAALRVDALFLVTTTDGVSSLPLRSSLARVAGIDAALRNAGWDEREIASLSPLTDASVEPPIEPSRIVLVLGERDDLTPIEGGRRLAAKWRVPPANLYLRDQGHFSAAFGLNADPTPFLRIRSILLG